MARKPDEDPGLALTEELVFGDAGLAPQRFTLAETLTGPTPDYRVFGGKELVAYCEVKSRRLAR